MRLAGLLLGALVAFAPVAQARACFCAAAPEAIDQAGNPSCCCGDAASCCCRNCPGHGQDGEDTPSSLSGCVCTMTQPQGNAEQPDDLVPAEVLAHDVPVAAEVIRAVFAVRTLEDNVRPACNRPLLV